jgi:BlaI family transcriptional regulator, penicillinase repressor
VLTDQTSPLHDLTDLQLTILDVLWERGEATVVEVTEALLEERALAMSTVATLLTRLEKRGIVAHRTEGRQYVFRALVSRDRVRESMLTALTQRLFRGDVSELLAHLVSESEISAGDLERVRALVEQKSKEDER